MKALLVHEILEEIRLARGPKLKSKILLEHKENEILRRILRYAGDPYLTFNIVKVPSIKKRYPAQDENLRWNSFFEMADLCQKREYTGNYAIEMIQGSFCVAVEEEEKWMRKILKKHLNIGASTKTINKVFPGLIPTFDVSLAQKFEEKRVVEKRVAVEPKLDGIRCFTVVENGNALMYARSGKLITNFDNTIGEEISKLGDGCYDGEIMGKDFIELMRQAYRKEDVNTDGTYLALFDYLPIREWKERQAKLSCEQRYSILVKRVPKISKHLRVVQRLSTASSYQEIKKLHDKFVLEGYEGVMIKDLDSPYIFGRGYEVMKLKAFFDSDCEVVRIEEGTGKYGGMCGSIVVDFNSVQVGIGSGLSDEQRKAIWDHPEAYIGRTVEVRYQEITPDGSLRFPTFVCWRNDKD